MHFVRGRCQKFNRLLVAREWQQPEVRPGAYAWYREQDATSVGRLVRFYYVVRPNPTGSRPLVWQHHLFITTAGGAPPVKLDDPSIGSKHELGAIRRPDRGGIEGSAAAGNTTAAAAHEIDYPHLNNSRPGVQHRSSK